MNYDVTAAKTVTRNVLNVRKNGFENVCQLKLCERRYFKQFQLRFVSVYHGDL